MPLSFSPLIFFGFIPAILDYNPGYSYFCNPGNDSGVLLERCLSGRKGRFAKPLYGLKSVPRVRIPPSPPSPFEAIASEGIFLNIPAKKQYQRATADKSAKRLCPPAIAKEGSPSEAKATEGFLLNHSSDQILPGASVDKSVFNLRSFSEGGIRPPKIPSLSIPLNIPFPGYRGIRFQPITLIV